MLAQTAALLLAALPFPAPRMLQVTERTKYDPGTVQSVDAVKGEVKVLCAAGVVTFKAGADTQVFDKAGQPVGSASKLAAGQKVGVYYVVDGGAKAQEIDLL